MSWKPEEAQASFISHFAGCLAAAVSSACLAPQALSMSTPVMAWLSFLSCASALTANVPMRAIAQVARRIVFISSVLGCERSIFDQLLFSPQTSTLASAAQILQAYFVNDMLPLVMAARARRL